MDVRKWLEAGRSRGRILLAGLAVLMALVAAMAPAGLAEESQGNEAAPATVPGRQDLGLTDEQTAQIRELRESALDQASSVQTQLFAKRQELARVMRSDDPDQSTALALVKEINALQGQLAEIQIRTQFAVRGVLTDEQRAKMGSLGSLGLRLGPDGGAGRGHGGGMGPMGCGRDGMLGGGPGW